MLPSETLPSKAKLTDSLAARLRLPDGAADRVVWDTGLRGFGLRLRPTGKTWVIAYRPAGMGRAANTRKLRLAPVDQMKAADARNLARVELGKVAAGADPAKARRAARVKEKSRLSDLLDQYEKDLKARGYVTLKSTIAGLRTKLAPLLNRDVREITGADLAAIIAKYEQGGRRGAGADFRARCRAFFTWMVVKPKVLATNPLAGFRKERATRADRIARAEHGRSLSDDELVKVWNAAAADTVVGRWVRFLILSGCRRGEAAGLTWAMLDRAAGVIRLPAVFTKQGRGHIVPITAAIADVLDACPVDARSDLVFASARSGGKMSGFTQLNERIVKAAGVEFLFHDLRRTFRTGLSQLGIDAETAELALGHARGDLEARYNRDLALDEQRAAFGKWADRVTTIVEQAAAKPDIFA